MVRIESPRICILERLSAIKYIKYNTILKNIYRESLTDFSRLSTVMKGKVVTLPPP
jgi:hypothetical protein